MKFLICLLLVSNLFTFVEAPTNLEGPVTAVGYWLEVYDGEEYVRFNVDYDTYRKYEWGGYYSSSEIENEFGGGRYQAKQN